MNKLTAILLCALLLYPALVRAADSTPPADAPVAVPVKAGAPAPRDGLIIDPDTFTTYLQEQQEAQGCDAKLKERDAAIDDATRKETRSWWEEHSFWIGFGLGVLAAGGTVYLVHTALK
jgi:hypothetical protein